ncbi:acyl carrier protein [Mycobacteriaceae bacterium 1482268.1]|nr:acyl carrier protein [Mycobacteriaceae bacterium 1482268.1]
MNADRRYILRWLATQLGSQLDLPSTVIDPLMPLAEMGVDSVHAVSLVGDVEAHFDIDVELTLVFDHPTLSHIADHIRLALTEDGAAA